MLRIRKIGDGILFGGMIFLLFLVVFESLVKIPSWVAVGGRLHPLLLHFPIVLLLIAFFISWLPAKNKTSEEWLALLRQVAALSAVITAIAGMLLSLEDDDAGNVLLLHKIGGVVTALLGYLFYAYYELLENRPAVKKGFTIAGALVITATGHWGATLTHGENYVLEPVYKFKKDLPPPEKAIVFSDIIQPILNSKCAACHNPSKLKGELLLTDADGVLEGGKSGELFKPGQPEMSLLIERLHLPLNEKKHMPPASKPQLTDAEAALLYAWIKSGAVMDTLLFSLPEQDTFRILATNYLQPEGPAAPVYDFKAADEKKVKELNNNYRVIVPLGKGSPALSVNLYGRNIYTSKSLEELLPLKQQIVELNLAHLPVKDEDIKTIKQFANLEKLNLNYTELSSAGVEQLTSLSKLRELMLSGTQVTATSLEKVLGLDKLKSVYIWDTPVDSLQLQPLKTKFSNIRFETGFKDDGAEITQLSPPVIKATQGIFHNAKTVEITHPFTGVEIRYTLDGTQPDSVTGMIYTEPIPIDRSVTLKASAHKSGWYGSMAAQATFIRQGFVPDSIDYITQADPQYHSDEPRVLIDGALGSFTNIANGEWLGYQTREAAFYLFFNEKVSPNEVLIQMMKNTGGDIFPAARLEVWGGLNEGHLQLLGRKNNPIPEKSEPRTSFQEVIPLSRAEVQCLKIIIYPVSSLPAWNRRKGNPAWIMLSEVVVN